MHDFLLSREYNVCYKLGFKWSSSLYPSKYSRFLSYCLYELLRSYIPVTSIRGCSIILSLNYKAIDQQIQKFMFLTEMNLYERGWTEILVEIVKYRILPYLIDIKIYAYSFRSSEYTASFFFFEIVWTNQFGCIPHTAKKSQTKSTNSPIAHSI